MLTARRIADYLDRLSLRRRFLVEPLLGLMVLSALTLAFTHESQRQNALLDRVEVHEFEAYGRYTKVFTDLAEQHMALFNLLQDAGGLDEETLYDRAKLSLHRIHAAVHALERALPETAGADREQAALRAQVLAATAAYRHEATQAVELGTVDLALGPQRLIRANLAFSAMNRAFVRLLEHERDGMEREVAAKVAQGKDSSALITLTGIAAALLLFALSIILSRLLSRSLERQITALSALGEEAGAAIPPGGADEVDRIADAIAAFRLALLQLRNHEEDLLLRERELREMNDSLRSEIELRKGVEKHLRIYEAVIHSTDEAVVITDCRGKIVEVNPTYEATFGRVRADVVGKCIFTPELGYGYRDDGQEAFHAKFWERLQREGVWTGEIMDWRANGESFPSWALVNAVRDEHGEVTHYVFVSRDITALKQSENQLRELAFYDSITHLPNRALFNDRLDVALAGAQRQQTSLAVIFIDLDRFKYVNDTLGHHAGDLLLAEIGQRIGACIRASDTIARMGGDEFSILLTHIDSKAEAVEIAERIIETVGMPILLGEDTVYVGASVGISCYPKDGLDAAALLKNADLAMFAAKRAGRGQYREFRPDMLAISNQHLSLSVHIDGAVKNGEFALHYQPLLACAAAPSTASKR